MAYKMTKQGSFDNAVTYEFMCDTIADMNAIENKYKVLGSIAIVLAGESDGLEIYIANSQRQWVALSVGAEANDSSATGGLSVHVCAQNEVSNGLPNIDPPEENTIYLVSSGNTTGNLYEEYIYVNNAWEKFGAANIDLSGLAPKANPVFTGSISMGRKESTTIGSTSVAIGYNAEASGGVGATAIGWTTTASGRSAHAEGQSTKATEWVAHAEGLQTHADGGASHAEGSHSNGYSTITINGVAYPYGAEGYASHVEGESTLAAGDNAHAEGRDTIALGANSHTGGKFNVPDSWNGWNEWVANTSYSVGDLVKVTSADKVQAYSCKTANSDETFTSSNWVSIDGILNYVEIIGNGTNTSNRSNARALDWNGNEYLKGDLFVGCNANSTGGTKLARIPAPPATNGTYTLQATVLDGTVTYTWI